VGELAPEMLDEWSMRGDWTVLTMDCDGCVWMDMHLS